MFFLQIVNIKFLHVGFMECFIHFVLLKKKYYKFNNFKFYLPVYVKAYVKKGFFKFADVVWKLPSHYVPYRVQPLPKL